MQVVTLLNLTHVLSPSLNTVSETIFFNSLIFQEFAKLKYTLNLKISKSQNLTNAEISRCKVSNPFFLSIQKNSHKLFAMFYILSQATRTESNYLTRAAQRQVKRYKSRKWVVGWYVG